MSLGPTGGPSVELLDARLAPVDAEELRNWARSRAAHSGGAYVTRSYRHPFALIARHEGPVGVDIERIQPYDRTFAESICTPTERSVALPGTAPGLAALWCSKEALAKALGDATRV